MKQFRTVRQYLARLPGAARARCQTLRRAIRQAAPQAREVIHYNMPAFEWNDILVWYAAFRNHIGFYPRAGTIRAFRDELQGYRTSKGAIQFPLEREIPAGLVKKMVRLRLKETAATKKQAGTRR